MKKSRKSYINLLRHVYATQLEKWFILMLMDSDICFLKEIVPAPKGKGIIVWL